MGQFRSLGSAVQSHADRESVAVDRKIKTGSKIVNVQPPVDHLLEIIRNISIR